MEMHLFKSWLAEIPDPATPGVDILLASHIRLP
jgi:hypothetical protein